MKTFSTIILFISTIALFGQNDVGINSRPIERKLTSTYFQDERTIKICLPENYDSSKKYPVIYTLDGYDLFPITSSYSHFLMKYDVIPRAIVVSIFHNDRNYETSPNYGQNINVPITEFLEGSEKLKNHLLNEVKPLIEDAYETSNYNVLVGHSNTATFVNEIISKNDNSFRAFIAMSPDLADEQFTFLEKHLSNEKTEKLSYFVASGLKDDQYRLATGKRLDSIFKVITNNNISFEHKIYTAGHVDLVPKSLNDALMFAFSAYRNFDDFEIKSKTPNFSAKDYLNQKIENTNTTYGIASTLNEDDYYYLAEQVASKRNKRLLGQILEVGEWNNFYTENHLYSDRAQWYEQAGFYEEALDNWKLQLEKVF